MDSDHDFGSGCDLSLTGSDNSNTSSQAAVSVEDADYEAERSKEFEEDIRRVARNILFMHLENQQLQKGKGKRQVAQICGQQMRSLAELPLGNIHDRIEPRLPASSRAILNAQLTMLHNHWRQNLLANDRRFVEVMGTQDDPNRSRLEQYSTCCYKMTA